MSVTSEAAAPAVAARPRNALGVLDKLESPDIKVYPMRCVEVRNRNAGCHACAEACTSGAISVVEGLLNVEASLCIGCGTCATVCPTCALEARRPTDDDLLARCEAALAARGGTELVIACTETMEAEFGRYDEAKVADVRCLGRVDESLLAELARRGCERVVLVERHCDACKHVAGRDAAREVVASAEGLLEAWGAPIEVVFAERLPEDVLLAHPFEGYGGTASFHAIPGEPAEEQVDPAAASDAAPSETSPRPLPEKVGKGGTLSHKVPNRRGRLLEALGALGEPAETTVTSRLWGTVSIDTEACGSCRLCAVFCPTGALHKFDDRATGTFGVEHTPAKCVKCRCCADICPKHAITITEEVFAPDIVDGHVERFEMRPREIEPGKPTTVVKKMRKLLSDSQFVNFA